MLPPWFIDHDKVVETNIHHHYLDAIRELGVCCPSSSHTMS